jgi:hypothetical protein
MVFVAGEDSHLYRGFWDEPQRKWVWTDHGMPGAPTLGRPFVPVVSSPAAVFLSKQNPLPRIAAFVRGKDGNLYTLYTPDDGQNWNWEQPSTLIPASALPFHPNTEPSAVYHESQDQAFEFAIGRDGHVYDDRWRPESGLWEDQGPLPGPSVNYPIPHAVYRASQDRLHLFATGQDGHLYANIFYQPSSGNWTWLSWDDAGLPPGSSISTPTSPHAVHHTSLDRVFAFVGGQNGHLYSVFYDDNQRKWVWEDQGSPPALCSAGFKCCGSPVLPNGSCDRQCTRRQFPCVAVRPR